jgi:hypothetical protein
VAHSLRKEDRRTGAAMLEELRRATLPAWTVNEVARRRRKDVDLLLDAPHRLASAHADSVAGGDPEIKRQGSEAGPCHLHSDAHVLVQVGQFLEFVHQEDQKLRFHLDPVGFCRVAQVIGASKATSLTESAGPMGQLNTYSQRSGRP